MKKASIALALLVSSASIAQELTLGDPPSDTAPDRSQRVSSGEPSMSSRVNTLEAKLSALEAMVTAIHGPNQPPTEPPVNPPMPEGGYAVYDAYGDFVGATEDGNDVRITLDQYPDLYFRIPALEENLLSWNSAAAWNMVFFPDSIDCSTQPFLLSQARRDAYASVTLLNPTPVLNSPEGVIWHNNSYSSIYFVADPNNGAEAVSAAIAGSSLIDSSGTCYENIPSQAAAVLGEDPIAIPASEVTIEIAYPLQVNFD